MADRSGTLIISLDFELYWGMFDKVTLEQYGEQIRGVHTAVPQLLALFKEYELHATWATVGMLMAESRAELEHWLPPAAERPQYANPALSSYAHLASGAVGEVATDDPYHFAPALLQQIVATPGQELGSHTFSHCYALDMTEDRAVIRADLRAAAKAAARFDRPPRTLVFPRNQATDTYLEEAAAAGIVAYRGNEDHYLYRARPDQEQTLFIRGLRLLDHYVNLSGQHTYALRPADSPARQPVNLPASRFLRPYSRRLRFLESLRLRRIKRAMTHAAKRGEVFHLWWHPHNFGVHEAENLAVLRELAEHYLGLQQQYGMQSMNMAEAAEATLTTNV